MAGRTSLKMTRRRQFIMAIIVMVVLVSIIAVILVVPKLFDGRNKTGSGNASQSNMYSKTLPTDAAMSAGKWFVTTISKYDGVLKDGMFEDGSSNDSSDVLNKMKNKDYSMIPHEIRDGFQWTADSKSDSKSVDNDQLVASGYLATMTAWQLRTDALKKDKNLGVDSGFIYVDNEHGTVQIPAEAYCGFPADLTVQLVWTGKDWKIDGSGTALPVLEKLRSEQVKQLLTDNGNGTPNENK